MFHRHSDESSETLLPSLFHHHSVLDIAIQPSSDGPKKTDDGSSETHKAYLDKNRRKGFQSLPLAPDIDIDGEGQDRYNK
jgi:hypothetical protein